MEPYVDPYDIVNEPLDEKLANEKSWKERDAKEKTISLLLIFVKIVVVFLSLYMFICSLSFLSSAFQLLGGKSAGEVFGKSAIFSNPIMGLMIGVLVTVLVQSSSTSTSIIVAMVAADIVQIRPAIFMVMGANIGTTVTNTIVSLGQSLDRRQFRRAFAGATVHDCFNWLCVCIFLPLEAIAHPLERLTKEIVDSLSDDDNAENLDFLKVITKPFTSKIVSVNKNTIKDIAKYCHEGAGFDANKCEKAREASMMKQCDNASTEVYEKCSFIFSGMGDEAAGIILLILSLLLLCVCLTILVKTLQSLLMGRMAQTLRRHINADLPYPFGWLTGYLFIIVGVGMTILVQSSSVFTSSITPLVGMGVISIERMFPLTLGSNIGTTATAMLAALAAEGDNRKITLQVAFSHLFFNIFGITLFYPVPFIRNIPISAAKTLGNTTAKYRWFAVAYLITVFLLIPGILIALSFNDILFYVVVALIIALILFITILNLLQKYCKKGLPECIQTWHFLPLPLRSLKPYDRGIMKVRKVIQKIPCLKKKRQVEDSENVKMGAVMKNKKSESSSSSSSDEGGKHAGKNGDFKEEESAMLSGGGYAANRGGGGGDKCGDGFGVGHGGFGDGGDSGGHGGCAGGGDGGGHGGGGGDGGGGGGGDGGGCGDGGGGDGGGDGGGGGC